MNYAARAIFEFLSAIAALLSALLAIRATKRGRSASASASAPMKWLEGHLDVMSVHASLFDGYRRDFAERLEAYLAFTGAVVDAP